MRSTLEEGISDGDVANGRLDRRAEKQDLVEFGTRLEAVIDRGFRQILITVSSLLIGGFLATIAATVAAALIR